MDNTALECEPKDDSSFDEQDTALNVDGGILKDDSFIPTLSGFRLNRLEVFNWGTFDGHIWSVNLNGKNSLLTGDIGSGKSTLVDAITTLLVPAKKAAHAYNKAAGADSKERSLRSYFFGYYKSESSSSGGTTKPKGLRDSNSYSAILGEFYHAGFKQTITLAQVFFMKDLQGSPSRFFVCAERSLSIKGDFANFGSDINKLKKRLRKNDVELFDSYPPYGAWFRRRFGIDNEQALDLFHQTVSMKSVGNLTEFVRNHMLEAFDVESRLSALILHFDDLTSAHDAVLKASDQINRLTPMVENWKRCIEINEYSDKMRFLRDALKIYFARLKLELLEERIAGKESEWQHYNDLVKRTEEVIKTKEIELSELKRNIAENGGDRIERLSEEIQKQGMELGRRKEKSGKFKELTEFLNLNFPSSQTEFEILRRQKKEIREEVKEKVASLQNSYTETSFRLRQKRDDHIELYNEIESLKRRRNNIPSSQLALRDQMCQALGIDSKEIAFAGELLQVKDEEKDWEGAIERVLHSFAISLLVPEKHYSEVAIWVDETHLRGRLVYYRVRNRRAKELPYVNQHSLVEKVAIKPDTEFYDWLDEQLIRRFNFICCDTQEQFRREERAITRQGQLKSSVEKHEKDDRYRIDDRSRYVLGWSNLEKIKVLANRLKVLETDIQKLSFDITRLQVELEHSQECESKFSQMEMFSEYREIDWNSVSLEIARLEEEKRHLEAASDVLRELTEKLKELEESIGNKNKRLKDRWHKRSQLQTQLEEARELLEHTENIIASSPLEVNASTIEELGDIKEKALGEQKITVANCFEREQDVRSWVQDKIENEDKKFSRLKDKVIESMTGYKKEYPLETQDVDISLESGNEFSQMLDTLNGDDLPRYQARFKELLNENTIREVAQFQSQLNRERETIKERIRIINESLTKIDYNQNRYIELLAQSTQDAEIRDFQLELKACTEGTFTGSDDEQYSEKKFIQVKSIIERFRGRDGRSDLDRRWTQRVTDVRNWFVFGASEKWREDDTEHEHYSDSGGKSGGQKEKLAYTILAASLAYQFGLDPEVKNSRSFRFVVIDEAFGRGSDESARYGLSLFEQLDLQLLVVTPMQKIHIIEPFVHSVGFVSNEGGNNSKLRNISIEEYREEKERLMQAKQI